MAQPNILVCGAGPLTRMIADRLGQEGASVTMVGDALAADIENADVVVFSHDDDGGNVDAALAARRVRRDLPLVVRLFDPALGAYLQDTLAPVTVLSRSSASAPTIADMAIRALSEPPHPAGAAAAPDEYRRGKRFLLDRVLVATVALGLLLVVTATLYFSSELNIRALDALYFVWTTIFTVGYGDISLREASDAAKLAGMALMLGGATLLAVLYAMLTAWVISQRVDVLRGRVRARPGAHLLIVGAGNIGYRVAQLLAARQHRIVVVERNGESRHVSELRGARHHIIVGDATLDETLRLARLESCSALLALTESDSTNLRVVLAARARRPDLPIVIRLASSELSAHVAERHDALPASSLDIASRAFANAALARAMSAVPRASDQAAASGKDTGTGIIFPR
jgi:Trk K+ transport system NAD-binding subunit